jgi:hypothetical protein
MTYQSLQWSLLKLVTLGFECVRSALCQNRFAAMLSFATTIVIMAVRSAMCQAHM